MGDVRLAVAEAGDPAGEPVVLLHGFPEQSRSWRYQLAALAEAGFRAAAPDLRGYGGSDRPAAVEAYSARALIGDVAGLIRALGHQSAHVVGPDWGGSLAWGLAAGSPAMVRSLTILNAPQGAVSARLRREDRRQQAKGWYMLLFQFPGVAEAWLSDDDFAISGRALGLTGWDRDHRYCGRCGAATERSQTERVRTCTRCGHGAYPPSREKCMWSGSDQSPPQCQPMASNAWTTSSPARIIPGRTSLRSR